MYVREFGAALSNPDLRPFAGRPPVKSKCMGFAGYARDAHQEPEEQQAVRSAFYRIR